MKTLENFFCKKKIEEIKKLKEENEELKQKLIEKQEHINKTNSYYKKKLYEINKSKKNL